MKHMFIAFALLAFCVESAADFTNNLARGRRCRFARRHEKQHP